MKNIDELEFEISTMLADLEGYEYISPETGDLIYKATMNIIRKHLNNTPSYTKDKWSKAIEEIEEVITC